MKVLRVILYVLCIVLILRGVSVFDMGQSAVLSFPTASAICLVGGAMLLFGMYVVEQLSLGAQTERSAQGPTGC